MRKQYKFIRDSDTMEEEVNKLAKEGYTMQFCFSRSEWGYVTCVMVRDVTPEQELEQRTADQSEMEENGHDS